MSGLIAQAAGKYGAFIWPAYAFSAIVFAGMIAATLGRAARFKREAQRRAKEGGE